MWSGIQHAGNCRKVAAKIGCKNFDLRSRESLANLSHGFGKVVRAAIGQIVSVNGRDHDIAKVHASGHFGYMARLVRV